MAALFGSWLAGTFDAQDCERVRANSQDKEVVSERGHSRTRHVGSIPSCVCSRHGPLQTQTQVITFHETTLRKEHQCDARSLESAYLGRRSATQAQPKSSGFVLDQARKQARREKSQPEEASTENDCLRDIVPAISTPHWLRSAALLKNGTAVMQKRRFG